MYGLRSIIELALNRSSKASGGGLQAAGRLLLSEPQLRIDGLAGLVAL
jgi:hypothetical protein